MANTLWTFGDSYTEGFESDWANDYIKWKGYKPEGFSDLLSRDLSLYQRNLAVSGVGNHSIFESVCKNIDQINENDFVIIGWTNTSRFRLVNENDNWVNLIPLIDENLSLFNIISKRTVEETLVNRRSIRFSQEIDLWIKIINKALPKTDIIHWTPFPYQMKNCDFIKCTTIAEESDSKINDWHYGEQGHQDLFKIFKTRYTKPIVKKNLI